MSSGSGGKVTAMLPCARVVVYIGPYTMCVCEWLRVAVYDEFVGKKLPMLKVTRLRSLSFVHDTSTS